MAVEITSIRTVDLASMKNVRSVLIVRLKALGDIVLSLPIVRALRLAFPEASIGYLCWGRYMEALAGKTGLDEVLGLPAEFGPQLRFIRGLRSRRYGAGRSARRISKCRRLPRGKPRRR